MPTKQEMLDAIYQKIADKTFKYWLNIIRNNMSKEKVVSVKSLADWRFRLETFAPSSFNQYWVFLDLRELEDIVAYWHPIMIGDIIYWLKKSNDLFIDNNDWYILNKCYSIRRDNYREPKEKQSEKCIKYVYDLIATA